MSEAQFVNSFGEVYESSPWVVKSAYAQMPFTDATTLLEALRHAVDRASVTDQDALIHAHPDLGGRLAREGQLTQASTREQARLGLDSLDGNEYTALDLLNQAYQERFHFPFIICLGLLKHRSQVSDAFQQRILNSLETERLEAIHQIHLIAQFRLSSLVEGIP